MAYAAGILPYTFHSGQVFMMLGKDVRDGSWSDFGGKSEAVDAKPIDTACREFYEETCGTLLDPKALYVRMAGQRPFCRTYTQHGKIYYMYTLQLPFRPDHRSHFRRMLAYMKHINCFKRKVEKTDIRWVPVDAMLNGGIRLRPVFENTFSKWGIMYDANSDGERTIQLMPEAGMGHDNIELVQHTAAPPRPAFTDTSFHEFANPDKVGPDNVAFERDFSAMPQEQSWQPAMMQQQQPSFAMPAPAAEAPASLQDCDVSPEAEVADLSFKLDRMRKKGIAVRTFVGSVSELREMRTEFNRIKSEIEFDNSIKFGKKALCGVVSVIEYLNQRFDPFEIQLDGWSESVMTSVDSYEGTLERLVAKYRHRINTPPEIELALSLAASGLMYHMTNTMFKQALLTNNNANPDFLKSMVGALSGNQAQQPSRPVAPVEAKQADTKYQMKGPGINLGPLMQTMPSPMPYPQQSNPPEPSRMHPPQYYVSPPPPPPPPPPPQEQQTTPPLAFVDEDRLSDINSEDMQSIRSLDLDSIAGSIKSQKEIKTFSLKSKRCGRAAMAKQRKQAKSSSAKFNNFDI